MPGAVLAQRSTMSWVVCELLSPGATGAVRSAESGSRETRMGSSDSTSRPRPAGPQQCLTFPRLKLPHFILDGAPEEHSAPSAAPCGQSSCLWRDIVRQPRPREAGLTGRRGTLTVGVYM